MITDMVLRVSGTVDFADGTTESFAAVYEDEEIVLPFANNSFNTDAFAQLWHQNHANVLALLQLLGGTYTMAAATPSISRTVNDWSMLVTGRISRDDGSNGVFSAVYDKKGGSRVIGSSVYTEVRSSTYVSVLASVLASLTGSTVKVK